MFQFKTVLDLPLKPGNTFLLTDVPLNFPFTQAKQTKQPSPPGILLDVLLPLISGADLINTTS